MEEKKQKESLWHVIKFTLFSLSAGIIQAVSFTAFNEVPALLGFAKWPYWACNVPSLVLSVLWNFTLNRKFTFCSANNVPIAMLKVACFYLVFAPLSTWWTKVLTSPAYGWNEYLVLVITMAINLVTEYLYCKYFVFRGSIDSAKK
jgi:putative flippase GtrA